MRQEYKTLINIRQNWDGKMQKQFLAVLHILLIAGNAFSSILYVSPVATNLNSVSPFHAVSVSTSEQQVFALVNGTEIYDYDLELENISLSHSGFRAAGSPGANEAANWIKQKFESFGLNASLEPFQFYNWTLLSKPSLVIDEDRNNSTTADQTSLCSFQSEHYSWSAPTGGIFADLAILPLPPSSGRNGIGVNPINVTAWNAVNTTRKIVLVGREIRWDPNWQETFVNKLTAQRPVAVVYTWWYSWMNFTPPLHSSGGGRPLSQGQFDPYYWDLKIPVGFVNYEDGLLIRQKEQANNVSAYLSLESVIGYGTHCNVVGKIAGHENPERFVVISAHYDTVMCSGFCDNGAGTAGIIELAKVFSEAVNKGLYKPRYALLFVAFTGEELDLVGSTNYVKEHKNDMPNIIAIINLDCIGSRNLYVTRTDPANGFDLDELVIGAAQALNISIAEEETGGSDQETFRIPSEVNNWYYGDWGLSPGISDARQVTSSAMIISYPLLYSNLWDMGVAGWIHTAYDNSTSTRTLHWVEPENLENHVKVAALSVMRVQAVTFAGFAIYIILAGIIVVPIVAFLLVRKLRSRKRVPSETRVDYPNWWDKEPQ
nr:M28 family peptidase [Candidatus Njordarchaeota archaeon]